MIIQDDQIILNKMLNGINGFNKRDNVINIVLLKCSIATCKNLKQKEKKKLSKTEIDLFRLLKEFEKLHNVKGELTISLVND